MEQISLGSMAVLPGKTLRLFIPTTERAEADLLAGAIERVISRETGSGVRNLGVEITRGVILLTGCCTTYYLKQRAQHAAMAICENWQVVNRIEVL